MTLAVELLPFGAPTAIPAAPTAPAAAMASMTAYPLLIRMGSSFWAEGAIRRGAPSILP